MAKPVLTTTISTKGQVILPKAILVAEAMNWSDAGMNFADALSLAAALGCKSFLTFAERFACSGTRLTDISVLAL